MSGPGQLIEVYPWEQPGYKPLVFSADWQVALLNWEPPFDWANVGEIERHTRTDEVFVLQRGWAWIFVSDGGRLAAVEMKPGVVYNVPTGTWHNLLSSRDASWVIVENRGTHIDGTELRQMNVAERASLAAQLPDWIKENSEGSAFQKQ